MYELTTAAEWTALARGFLVLLLVGLPVVAATGVPDEELADLARGVVELVVLDGHVVVVVELAELDLLERPLQFVEDDLLDLGEGAGLDGADVGWRAGPPGRMALWTVGCSLAGLGLVWLVTRAGQRVGASESPLVRFLLPRTRREQWGFAVVSAVAGVGEEYLFRGFLLHGLADWTGS
ncbi:MAG: hypothetical protein ABEJ46_04090, partial [Gemmatimonadota bacterium]